jgi:glutathione peroxidase
MTKFALTVLCAAGITAVIAAQQPQSFYDLKTKSLDGKPGDLAQYKGKVSLVVNVASKCGYTPQYEGLEKLHEQYASRGFEVLGFPCNQFMGQEPGTSEEIREFCSTTYGVQFPIFEKIDVNGDQQHPIFAELEQTADADGEAGDVKWNFEKFLVSPSGEVVGRFRPQVTPEDPALVSAIEAQLPS